MSKLGRLVTGETLLLIVILWNIVDIHFLQGDVSDLKAEVRELQAAYTTALTATP